MTLTPQQIKSVKPFASQLGVKLAALIAVIEVESDGVTFATVDGKQVPVIRWEGHYFYKLLKGAQREHAVREGLASPTAGAIKNPTSQVSRYRMLERAAAINSEAAYSSISIGVGQVMGANAKSLGFTSAKSMFDRARKSFAGQVDLMVRFIDKNSLVDELQRLDWSAFARVYNGPNYAKGGYHTKMAKAYTDAVKIVGSSDATDTGSATTMLRLGSKGAGVREVQTLLVRAGYSLNVDGDFGPSTRDAVKVFQHTHGIRADGVVGPETFTKLQVFRVSASENVSQQRLVDLPEAAPAAVSTGGGLSVALAADKMSEIAGKIGGSDTLDVVSSGLYTVAGILVVGGLLWGAYGMLKSRRTYEGLA